MVIVETDMLVDLGETAPQAGGRFPGRALEPGGRLL